MQFASVFHRVYCKFSHPSSVCASEAAAFFFVFGFQYFWVSLTSCGFHFIYIALIITEFLKYFFLMECSSFLEFSLILHFAYKVPQILICSVSNSYMSATIMEISKLERYCQCYFHLANYLKQVRSTSTLLKVITVQMVTWKTLI